jgi:hypothetical protein
MVTALAPLIGYDAAATIAHEAVASGKTVRESGAAQNRAYSRATRKSFGALEHDHAGTRKSRSKSARAKHFFFCYKPGNNFYSPLICTQQEPPLSCFLGVIDCLI